jgi:RimJ/RimL family protein N-acetyltransferase
VLAEPELAPWLWPDGVPRTREQTAALLGSDEESWAREGFGPWIVSDRAGGAVLGRVGLAYNVIGGERVIELDWLLTSSRWGEGLATEMAREAVRAGFEDLGLEELVAITLTRNAASRAVMAKLGMSLVCELEHAGLPHVQFTIRR